MMKITISSNASQSERVHIFMLVGIMDFWMEQTCHISSDLMGFPSTSSISPIDTGIRNLFAEAINA